MGCFYYVAHDTQEAGWLESRLHWTTHRHRNRLFLRASTYSTANISYGISRRPLHATIPYVSTGVSRGAKIIVSLVTCYSMRTSTNSHSSVTRCKTSFQQDCAPKSTFNARQQMDTMPQLAASWSEEFTADRSWSSSENDKTHPVWEPHLWSTSQ
jgi:hypothetical protein